MSYWIHIMIVTMTVLFGRKDQVLVDAVGTQKYPCAVEFMVDYVRYYSYNEIYIVIFNQDRNMLEAFAKDLIKGRIEATTRIIRPAHWQYGNISAFVPLVFPRIVSVTAKLPHGFSEVSVIRRPIFVSTAGTIVELQATFDWTVGDASRYHPWLVIGDDKSRFMFDYDYFPLDNKVTIVSWKDKFRDDLDLVNIEIWEAYQATPNLAKKYTREGFWSNFSLFLSSKEREGISFSFPNADISPRRNDFMGLHIKCLTESWKPFTDNVDLGGGEVTIGGVMGETFRLLSEALNFTYSCHQAPDHQFGDEINGSWTGLVRELIDNKGHIIVAPLDKTARRSQIIDFTVPSGTISYDLIIRRPQPNTLENYLRILEPNAWLVYFLIVVITCAIYVVFLRVKGTFDLRDLFDGAFSILSIHLNQATVSIRDGGLSRRVFFMTNIMTAWLILEFYMSDLLSFLASPVTETPFDDISGLLDNGGYKLGLQRGNSEIERLRNATDVILQRVWSDIVVKDPSNIVPSVEVGLKRVREEYFAFLTDRTFIKFNGHYDCSVMQVGTELFKYGVGMAVQKNSSWRDILDYHILRLQASGITDRYWEMYNPPEVDCDIEISSLGLSPLLAPFASVLFGFVLCIFIFVAEWIYAPDDDQEERRFGPEDNRLMYASFKDGLRMLGYRFDRDTGISKSNEWEEDEILSLLMAYKRLKPKGADPYSMTSRHWRKIGASIDKEPRICEEKFKELYENYVRYKKGIDTEEWNLKQAVYFYVLQEIVSEERSLLSSGNEGLGKNSLTIEDVDFTVKDSVPEFRAESSASIPGTVILDYSDFRSPTPDLHSQDLRSPTPPNLLSLFPEEERRCTSRRKTSRIIEKFLFPKDK